MTRRARKDGGVNRLIDMVVEEVSLVDRAANNRQFLIVKRDESMDEEDDNDTNKAEGDTSTADDTTGELAAGSPLDAALTALESLTSIVEVLGSLGANRADTRLAELARELRDTADQILTQVNTGETSTEPTTTADAALTDGETLVVENRAKPGGKPSAKPGKKPSPKPPATEPSAEAGDVAEQVKAAKSALASLTKLLSSAATPDLNADLTTNVTKLTESVQELTTCVKDQAQRLGRVEKQFGLPNSAAPAEKVAKGADENVGWPLDLNHPMDRQNVDKAISFHDPE